MRPETRVITVRDDNRDLVFTVEAKFVYSEDCGAEVHACTPLRGYVVMPIIAHRERVALGRDKTEEFEFTLPTDAAFRKRFLQDYCDVMEEVLTDEISSELEASSVGLSRY
jgi:hypothetical protein